MALAKDLKVNGLVEVPEKPIKQEKEIMKPYVDDIKREPSSSRKPKKVAFNIAEDENWLKKDYSVESEVIVENDSSDLSDENLLVTMDTMPRSVNDCFGPEISIATDSSDLSVDLENTTVPLQLENLSELEEKVARLLTKSPDNIW